MTSANVGETLIWKGETYTVLGHYNQPMVQIVDSQNRGQSVPLSRLIADMMRAVREGE